MFPDSDKRLSPDDLISKAMFGNPRIAYVWDQTLSATERAKHHNAIAHGI